jgi:hypothetical protein
LLERFGTGGGALKVAAERNAEARRQVQKKSGDVNFSFVSISLKNSTTQPGSNRRRRVDLAMGRDSSMAFFGAAPFWLSEP